MSLLGHLLFFLEPFLSVCFFFYFILLSLLFGFLCWLLVLEELFGQRYSQSFEVFFLVQEKTLSLASEMCAVDSKNTLVFDKVTEFCNDEFARLIFILGGRSSVGGDFFEKTLGVVWFKL